jgi:hypothetical protein
MSSQWNRPIIDMLEEVGAQKLPSRHNHLKYRLPSGKIFITSSTPSRPTAFDNALADLRRELRKTHPEVADRGRHSVLRNRLEINTIGAHIAAKEEIDPITAVGGSLPQAEFSLTDNDPEEAEDVAVVASKPLFERPKPKVNGIAMSYSPEVIAEAGRIEIARGRDAMNRYLESQTKVPAVRTAPTPSPEIIESQMGSVIGRARATLAQVEIRLAGYAERIAAIEDLKRQQEADEMKKIQLEEYIQEHERLAASAASLLEILPPPPPPVHAPVHKRIRRKVTGVHFSMAEMVKAVRPILENRGLAGMFTPGDVLKALTVTDLPLPHPNQYQIGDWLYQVMRDGDGLLEKAGRGYYRYPESV